MKMKMKKEADATVKQKTCLKLYMLHILRSKGS